ncbi:nucleoside monophosphate kinase [Candidatus Dojkabacteria bacterium]|uniref:Adenylate kinase n=1 Tax=Candidatus Dojkabacteria bacterium TaxID=2099670 RepID=A0A955L3B9_9BACT|nr:nucleoside monophosphate kinase [Candidatus Dojkabacteria bacterium]
MLIFAFIGPSGCGKDTQAELLSKNYQIPNISSGSVLRDLYNKKDKLGVKAAKHWLKGKWVPDDLMMQILEVRMKQKDCKDGFILNGFPRTLKQAEVYGEKLNTKYPFTKVIYFDLTDEEAVKRLSNRRICKDCGEIYHLIFNPPKESKYKCDKCGGKLRQRTDDKEDLIINRLKSFHKSIEKILGYYEERGLLLKIDASPSIDSIHKELLKRLKEDVK